MAIAANPARSAKHTKPTNTLRGKNARMLGDGRQAGGTHTEHGALKQVFPARSQPYILYNTVSLGIRNK